MFDLHLRVCVHKLACVALLALVAPSVSAQQVYNNNFSVSAGSEWSNNTISTASTGERFLAPTVNGFGLGNNTVTLTLNGLTPHSAATINFDLYIIQSWDGSAPGAINGGGSGDRWGFTANGNTLLNTSFANFGGGNTQDFQSQANPNVPGQAPHTGEFADNHLGFGDNTNGFGDTTYRFSYTFTDVAPTLSFVFTDTTNEGIGNEGWGLDNVSVILTPAAPPAVPEPGSLALLIGMGVTGSVFARRRKANNNIA